MPFRPDQLTELSSINGQHAVAGLLKDYGEPFEIVIRGQCMEPALLHGDRVRVTPAARLQAGDIVVFNGRNGAFTAHRLLGRIITTRGSRWMTRPDNNAAIDGLLRREQIIGRVTCNLSRPSEVKPGLAFRALSSALLMKHSLRLAIRKFARLG